MVSLYGWGLKGKRIKDYIPDARWKSLSILSSLRIDGTTEAIVYKGGLSGEFFKVWLKEHFVKTLKEGDIVIMDNLSSHKVAGIKEIVSGVGAKIEYLPQYSPDFNPIEFMWSKIKINLRKISKVNLDDLTNAVGKCLNEVTASDASGWYKHCGYYL